jgi:uncharacterized protein (DUF1501 family)
MFHHDSLAVNRRDFLRTAALGSASLAPVLRAGETRAATLRGGRIQCIGLFLSGGMSHLDLWDLKPDAPAGIRGEFSPVDTAVPGIRVSSLLPRVARIADKLAIVRSMTHGEQEHPRATSLMAPGWFVNDRVDPAAADRRSPLGADAALPRAGSLDEAVSQEPEAIERLYGPTDLGRSCLRARQRIEAGASFVGLRAGHWDTHRKNSWCLRELLAPAFDHAFAALIDDLDARGLLDSTLVVVATEFGRSPRINTGAGRDHWPGAFSVILAGAGIPGGQTIGATDRLGATVTDRPITPTDLEAAIGDLLRGSMGTSAESTPRCARVGRSMGGLVS